MSKNYETPTIQITDFDCLVETEGGSIVVNYPWKDAENEGFFE